MRNDVHPAARLSRCGQTGSLPLSSIRLALLSAAAALLLAMPAAADEPPAITGRVTDAAGVLSAADRQEIDGAITGLEQDVNIDLFAVIVTDTGGVGLAEFARLTWERNGLKANDVLLLIAVAGRDRAFWSDGSIPGLTAAELAEVLNADAGPAVDAADYAGAIAAAARGLARAASASSSPDDDIPTAFGLITDLTGLLQQRSADITAAIESLRAGDGIDLFVLWVEDTGTRSLTAFLKAFVQKNGLGGNDVVMGVAIGEFTGVLLSYSIGFWVGDGLGATITEAELDDLASGPVRARFRNFDFAGAVIAAAQGLSDAHRTEEIPSLDGPVTDRAGVLGGSLREIERAIEELGQETALGLNVLLVRTTGDLPAQEFASRVSTRNPGTGGSVLLVIATGDRTAAAVRVASLDELNDGELEAIVRERVEPFVLQGNPGAAVLAATDGLRAAIVEAPAPTPAPGTQTPAAGPASDRPVNEPAGDDGAGVVLLVLVLGVLAIGAVWAGGRAVSQRRERWLTDARRRRVLAEIGEAANAALLGADDALEDAELEAGLAEAELGAAEAASLRTAIGLAREELKAAWDLKRRLDDREREDEETQARMLQEIVRRCEDAVALVRDERRRVSEVRDLERNAPELLARLAAQADEVESRLPAAEAALQRLQGYAGENWVSVRGNVDEARRRIERALEQAAGGRAALARGDRRGAAQAARAAGEALYTASALLAGIERAEKRLLEVQRTLVKELEVAEDDVRAARDAVDAGRTSGFTSKLREAEESLRLAQELAKGERPDVVAASHLAARATAAAAQVLAGVRRASDQAIREAQWLEAALRDAEAAVGRARDFIGPRRVQVHASARTRLAHAEHYLELARTLYEGDRAQATASARKAEAMADRALELARGDDGGPVAGSARISPLELADEVIEAIERGRSATGP